MDEWVGWGGSYLKDKYFARLVKAAKIWLRITRESDNIINLIQVYQPIGWKFDYDEFGRLKN